MVLHVKRNVNLWIDLQDGFVLVGSVAGQRYWSTILSQESTITAGSWTPDDQQVRLAFNWDFCHWSGRYRSTGNVRIEAVSRSVVNGHRLAHPGVSKSSGLEAENELVCCDFPNCRIRTTPPFYSAAIY